MICPKHNKPVEDCVEDSLCLTSIALIELSGKMISDGDNQDEADRKAIDLYERETKKQKEMFG